MFRKLTAASLVLSCFVLAAPNASAAPMQTSARTASDVDKATAQMIIDDAVAFYEREIDTGYAAAVGVLTDYQTMLYLLNTYEVYLSCNFTVLQDLLTPVEGQFTTDQDPMTPNEPPTGSEALNSTGPLANVYTGHKRKNIFGGVIGTAGLCAKPFVDKEKCEVGFGDGTGPAPYYRVPRAVLACTITGNQCGWVECPGIPGWSSGWRYRCCNLTFVCEQNWFIFDTSVTITDTIYAAKCDN